ncbi:DUF3885 domain-containing protein [Paenibacillus sp. YAF4_2]|uniref:DUF3885 domain-containing protein n=1 Tax=Paenibacillus sp. YAF4_2 TaxID=3233085 RepID=UPI003F9A0F23
MSTRELLESLFPDLSLRTGLYNVWPIGIRFELGDLEALETDMKLYMEQVYYRATNIFKHLFSLEDDTYLIVNVINEGSRTITKTNVFKKYIKSKKVLRNLSSYTEANINDSDSESIQRLCLKCSVSDISYNNLIKAICNTDMGLKPNVKHEVFFVNISKEIILQIYDDRGCDVISTNREQLRSVYKEFNDWILEYNRKEIEENFTL